MDSMMEIRWNAAARSQAAPRGQYGSSAASSAVSSPSEASTVSVASPAASLPSLELDDWLPAHKDADDLALMDALLLAADAGEDAPIAWLGDGLHYEPDQEPAAAAAAEASHAAGRASCGSGGGCGGGGGAQFPDLEALLAAGGCCRGEAGASACCRVAAPASTSVAEERATSERLAPTVQAPLTPLRAKETAAPRQDEASPGGCGCSDGSCSSSGGAKSLDGDGGGSSDSTASSSASSTGGKPRRLASANGAAPRTRKRRSHLSPEERAAVRREQHRETMRRSRQRFRDQVDAMKETVEHLETVKANALAALELSASVFSSASAPSDAAAPDMVVLRDQLAFLEREEQQLVREKQELHAQVVQSLLEIVASHPSNFRAITGANHQLAVQQGGAVAAASVSNITSEELTLCDFVTWDATTIGHCLALVRDSYAEISHFYATVDGNAGYSPAAYSDGHFSYAHSSSNLFRSGLELMGWRDHRRFRGDAGSNSTCLEFAFEKLVPAADARELFVKTWMFCRDQRSFASMFAPAVAALEVEVLHEIHDNLVVVRRMHQEEEEMEHGEHKRTTKFRSIDLLYRIDAVDEGDDSGWSYVVFRSVNPSFVQSCGCAGNAWFDSYMWFGFAPGVGGSRVRFGGTLDGHSRAYALRWMLAIFFVLLRWESANVAPLLIVP